MKEQPVRFIAVQRRRFAMVFCAVGSSELSHRVFELSNSQPTLIQFPILEHPEGFGTTSAPGAISWNSEAKILQAEKGSDISCGNVRHTFRLGTFFKSFAVVRVDYKLECGENEWTKLWDASKWALPTKAK